MNTTLFLDNHMIIYLDLFLNRYPNIQPPRNEHTILIKITYHILTVTHSHSNIDHLSFLRYLTIHPITKSIHTMPIKVFRSLDSNIAHLSPYLGLMSI